MSSNNITEPVVWIETERLTEIVRQNGITNEISDVKIVLPNLQGDHFASTCATATVVFKETAIPPLELFMKKPITNPEFANLLREVQMYEKEAEFFNTLLPDLVKYCEQKKDYNGFLEGLFPKCYFADEDLIVMENLVKDGYEVLDKTIPHTVEQARFVLDKFAKMHGTTYAFINELTVESFKSKYPFAVLSFWCAQGEKLNAFWVQMVVDGAIRILEACPTEGSESALEFLKQYETNAFRQCCKQYDFEGPSCGTVVNHGDIWSCNLMFKIDQQTKALEECAIIDLQTTFLGSPALDLQYYLFLSMDTNVCHQNLKSLLQYYYDQFKLYVEKLGGQLNFSYQDLVDDFRNKCTTGFFFGFYNIFGFEMHKQADDVEDIEGDVGDHLASTMASIVDKNMSVKGKQYSEQIVNAFIKYNKLVTEGI